MSKRARLVALAAAALACLAAGAAGYRLGVQSVVPRHRPIPMREAGYRFVNPLLACDAGSEILRDEDLRPFREKVAGELRTLNMPGVEAVSVYFRELNDGIGFSLGEAQRFVPASLRKLPMMIAVLKLAEHDPTLLDRRLPFDLGLDHNAQQTYKPAVTMVRGETYTVRELIRRMIVYSDNNAFMLLGAHLEPRDLARTYVELSVTPPGQEAGGGQFLPAEVFASFFRALYNASYLGKDLSEFALATLAQSDFRGGIVQGLPRGTPVAHKFGESRDDAAGKVQLHDCGIVYDPQHPYVLCVMTRGTSFEHLDDAIASIARVVHAEVRAQELAAR